jgi:hypothetical protein
MRPYMKIDVTDQDLDSRSTNIYQARIFIHHIIFLISGRFGAFWFTGHSLAAPDLALL